MMQDLAMHILDLGQNSIRANAKNIEICLWIDDEKDCITFRLVDDGIGMDEDMQKRVLDPFFSTRTTRKIGLGIPFIKELAELCNGSFLLQSEVGKGTTLEITLQKSCWDTPPLGDVGEAMMMLIQADGTIEYVLDYRHHGEFIMKTTEIKEILGDVNIQEPSILLWLKQYINENIK
ncbi:MAG: ATP-binding protein [Erysipelotrichaceae bacterium]|nr:ATP-binding protein [Erysipelotrichaceae bacterium]